MQVAWVPPAHHENPFQLVKSVEFKGSNVDGGEVAGPIATRILERTVALDEGNFDMQVAWVPPAHHENPFQLVKSVEFKGSNVGGGEDEEDAGSSSADVQMASDNAAPDVEQEPDAAGKVKGARVVRAQPAPTPRPLNFFERLFGAKRPAPQATPVPPARRRF